MPVFKSLIGSALLLFIAACASRAVEEPPSTTARVATAPGVAHGDCVEARRRAVEKPDLDVDRLPAIVRQSPAPFQRMPAAVKTHVDRNGALVRIEVVIDTLGRPDMKTFKVVQTSHPWLAQNVKGIMPRWTFSSAELAGCKVARIYKFSATAAAKRRG